MEFLLRPVVGGSAVGWPQAVCMSWPGRAWTWSTCCRRAGAPRVRLGARCGPARRPGRGRLLGAAPVSGPGHGSGLPRARAARLPPRARLCPGRQGSRAVLAGLVRSQSPRAGYPAAGRGDLCCRLPCFRVPARVRTAHRLPPAAIHRHALVSWGPRTKTRAARVHTVIAALTITTQLSTRITSLTRPDPARRERRMVPGVRGWPAAVMAGPGASW